MKIKMIVDLEYDSYGVSRGQLQKYLQDVIKKADLSGAITGDSDAELNGYVVRFE